MEIPKQQVDTVEFAFDDAVFLVKKQALSHDRFIVSMQTSVPEFVEACIRQMVVGWRGITMDGVTVPYSFETMKRIPSVPGGKNLWGLLADFIVKETDIMRSSETASKNA